MCDHFQKEKLDRKLYRPEITFQDMGTNVAMDVASYNNIHASLFMC